MKLTKTRITAGKWQGRISELADLDAPRVGVYLDETSIAEMSVGTVKDGTCDAEFEIPITAISEGLKTFLFLDEGTGNQVGHFVMLAGDIVEDDVRADVNLLRAELDILKKAFRKHCADSN